MSILTVAWSMCAAICAMMALLQLLIWFMDRHDRSILWSVLMGFSAAMTAILELRQMLARDPAEYAVMLIWQNATIFLLLVSLIWYVHSHFRAGRVWLAWVITLLWSISLVVNFLSPNSVTFTEVVELRQYTTAWGEAYSLPVGPSHPWKILPDLASLLIAIFILDAALQLWRRGEKRRAGVAGTGMLAFIGIGGVHTVLVDAGLVTTPYMVSFAFLAIVMALAYELVATAVKAARYAQEILVQNKRWRELLENVHLAVIGCDPAGNINYVNPYLSRLLGITGDRLTGRSLVSLVPESVAGELQRRLEIAAATGPRPQSRWDLVCASGELRELEWSTVRINDAKGRFAGLLSIGADVTERYRAERELTDTRQQMERLARASLLGELASALAHELNQPLTAILANAQAARRFLQQSPSDLDEFAEILDDIVRDDKRAGEVIHRLRSMLQTGESPRERVSLNDVVGEVMELMKGEMQAQHIEVRLELQDDLPDIEAGKVEIQQVLMNLALNAVQALCNLPEKSREILIRTRTGEEGMVMEVEDNGPGIAEDILPRVLEPFVTNRSKGLGMGLAISRRIVEACGGRLQAANREPSGARFSLVLPPVPAARERTA